MYAPQKGKTGFRRIINAFYYSIDGLKAAFQSEAAFRQIVLVSIILIPVSFFLHVSMVERVLLIGVCLLSLIVELLNSAIEAVVDRISTEYHELSKRAKDMGSAAQLLASSFIFITWAMILYGHYWR